MNKKNLEHAIGNIDSRYLEEAMGNSENHYQQEPIENIENHYQQEAIENIENHYQQEAKRKTVHRKNRILKRLIYTAASILAVMVISVTGLSVAAAAGNSTATGILLNLYPNLAMKLSPVNISCIDQGIEMNVESIYVHGSDADIYISVRDLEGDRIDETIDLFDSYDIHTEKDLIGGCSLVDYDEETGKASFLIQVNHMHQIPINGEKMKFSISKLLSNKENIKSLLPQIQLADCPEVTDVQTDIRLRGRSCSPEYREDTTEKFLYPNEEQHLDISDQAAITAYGFIDNKLHVQVLYRDILTYDNHGFLFLCPNTVSDSDEIASPNSSSPDTDAMSIPQDMLIYPVYNAGFFDETRTDSYEEYIFNVGPDDIKDYTLYGEFTLCSTHIDGNWEVTFPIENMD